MFRKCTYQEAITARVLEKKALKTIFGVFKKTTILFSVCDEIFHTTKLKKRRNLQINNSL